VARWTRQGYGENSLMSLILVLISRDPVALQNVSSNTSLKEFRQRVEHKLGRSRVSLR
jgi:hypothetical protein